MQGRYWCRGSKPLQIHRVTVKGKCLLNYLIGLVMLDCWVNSAYYTLLLFGGEPFYQDKRVHMTEGKECSVICVGRRA